MLTATHSLERAEPSLLIISPVKNVDSVVVMIRARKRQSHHP